MNHKPASAEELFARSQRGDQAAFAGLVSEHQSMVFSIAWHYLQDRETAEELAQEVFLEMYRCLAKIESAAHLLFWLRRVTTNRCIDYSRRRQSQPNLRLEDIPEPSGLPAVPDTFLDATLQKLTARLSEKPRLVLILRYQEDLEPSEIARVLGMPLNTVKSHLQRSLAFLREELEKSKVRQQP